MFILPHTAAPPIIDILAYATIFAPLMIATCGVSFIVVMKANEARKDFLKKLTKDQITTLRFLSAPRASDISKLYVDVTGPYNLKKTCSLDPRTYQEFCILSDSDAYYPVPKAYNHVPISSKSWKVEIILKSEDYYPISDPYNNVPMSKPWVDECIYKSMIYMHTHPWGKGLSAYLIPTQNEACDQIRVKTGNTCPYVRSRCFPKLNPNPVDIYTHLGKETYDFSNTKKITQPESHFRSGLVISLSVNDTFVLPGLLNRDVHLRELESNHIALKITGRRAAGSDVVDYKLVTNDNVVYPLELDKNAMYPFMDVGHSSENKDVCYVDERNSKKSSSMLDKTMAYLQFLSNLFIGTDHFPVKDKDDVCYAGEQMKKYGSGIFPEKSEVFRKFPSHAHLSYEAEILENKGAINDNFRHYY